MANTWISADWHLGEDRMSIMNRPHKNGEDMMTNVIHLFNELVKPEDTVIVAGDVCYQKNLDYLPWVNYFFGHKILIRGNHDRVLTDEQFKPYFDTIIPDGEGIEIDAGGVPCYITHYPTRSRKDRFNLVGHIHSAWRYQLNMFNIGIDANHFLPINLNTIPNHLKAISEYYDQDVWVAYNEINSAFVGKRGKAGNYFENR